MWNQNLWWERSQSQRLKHTGPNVSLWNRAAWAQPLAGSLCFGVLLHKLLQSNRFCPAIRQCIALPCQKATNYQWDTYRYFSCSAIGQLYIGSYLMISANQLSSGRATGEVIQLRDSGEVIQLIDRGALVIWHLPLGHLLFFFFNWECISGRWGKLSFPIQYKCWSVPKNIIGGDIYVFLVSDV